MRTASYKLDQTVFMETFGIDAWYVLNNDQESIGAISTNNGADYLYQHIDGQEADIFQLAPWAACYRVAQDVLTFFESQEDLDRLDSQV